MRLITVVPALVASFCIAAASTAHSHTGGGPKHGGVVSTANDLAFELVASGDGATLYVEDHGKPKSTAGMSGKLTVLNGTEKKEAELRPAGENRLEAKGVTLTKGTKSVVTLSGTASKAFTVRFSHR